MSAAKKSLSHRKYPRASSFYAMSNCEVSFQLSQASGEEPATSFSDRGTEVHKVISGKLKPEEVDQGIVDEANDLVVTRNRLLREWHGGDLKDLPVIREKRIWLRLGVRPIYSGHPDEYVVGGKRAFLTDYKTSWHPLDEYAATNCQLRAYVPLISLDQKRTLEEVTAAIVKPGKLSPVAVFDRQAIKDATDWAMDVATRAVSKGVKKPTRGAWCKFCSGKVLCPLWRDEMLSLAELSSAIAHEVPDSMLRNIAPRLHLAKEVAERLLDRLYERVKARPDFFGDWRFEPAQSRRKIEDTVEAYNQLVVRNPVLSPGEFLSCCRIAITEVETRIRKAKNTSVHETQRLLAELLSGIMESRRGKDILLYDPKAIDTEQELLEEQ